MKWNCLIFKEFELEGLCWLRDVEYFYTNAYLRLSLQMQFFLQFKACVGHVMWNILIIETELFNVSKYLFNFQGIQAELFNFQGLF